MASAANSEMSSAGVFKKNDELVSDYPPLSAKDTQSFAYQTVKDRLPVILTRVIDLLFRERNEIIATYGQDSAEETKAVIGILSKLKNEMQTNKQFVPLTSDFPDVAAWNASLDSCELRYGSTELRWFDLPFLYVECYMYRRIFEAFQLSTSLKWFDYFQKQKEDAFLASLSAMQVLGNHLNQVLKNVDSHNENELRSAFLDFIQISLWGNRCDLSISAGRDNSQKSNPLMQLESLKPNIIVDEAECLWKAVHDLSKKKKDGKAARLDIVLDNAGFELFCDLCLAYFLHEMGLVGEIRWYAKVMPWYVSDTMAKDLKWTLQKLAQMNHKTLSELGIKWKKKFSDKAWTVEEETFWTLPHDFSEMKDVDPKLYNKLSTADVILFKGDLNYRKLIGDKQWPFTTPFNVALRGFEPSTLCALRTIKCDVLAGVQADRAKDIDAKDVSWMLAGEYAVIQCLTLNNNN